MNDSGPDCAVALSAGATLFGIAGTIGEAGWLTVAAIIMLFAAIGAIVTDTTSPETVLAASGFAVGLVGVGASTIGYIIGSDLLAVGGLAVAVCATVVAVTELWGAP